MSKTQEQWKELDRWTSDKSVQRIGVITAEIECMIEPTVRPSMSDVLDDLADEAIVLMLNTLKQVVEEKRWTGVRPLDLFEGVYGELSGESWEVVVGRFLDTKRVVEAYREGAGKKKMDLKNKLIARGFI